MDRDPTPLPLLATAQTRHTDGYAALFILFITLCVGLITLGYGTVPLPRIAAFIPAVDTGLALLNLITAMLLIGQVRQIGAPSLLMLGCGYIFAAILAVGHMLSFPGIFAPLELWTATYEKGGRVYVCWHIFFVLFVLGHAVLTASRFDVAIGRKRLTLTIILAVVATAVLAFCCIVFSNSNLDWLPDLLRQNNYTFPRTRGFGFTVVSCCILAIVLIYAKTRARNVLSLWICIVLMIWIVQILIAGRVSLQLYDAGWYLGRFFELLGCGVVLSALLIETGALYAHLNQLAAEKSAQSVALSKSEAALRQAQKMEAIGQMTGGVAHDFNNLLTVIIGSLDIIQRQPDDRARAERLAGHAMSAALKGAQLTKQLLIFSRRQVTRPETVDLNRLINDFGALMRQAVGEAIDILLDLDPAIEPVRLDPTQFEAAILNLSVNARDAMDGRGVMTIATGNIIADAAFTAAYPGMKQGAYVAVAISDTGTGMDEETISHAFEPFFTTKEVGKGSGLGLSQVYGFVRGANGAVKIESAIGAGTTVELFFPRTDDVIASPRQNPPAELSNAENFAPKNLGAAVLIVEDDIAVLNVAVEIVRGFGCAVSTATNGAEALERMRSDASIDILFSDFMMPGGMNGVELAIEAARIRPDLKILLTSGYMNSAKNRLPPGSQFIAKPYSQEDLGRILRSMLAAVVGRSRET